MPSTISDMASCWKRQYDEACRKFSAGEIDAGAFGNELRQLGFTGTWDIEAETALHAPSSPGRPIL